MKTQALTFTRFDKLADKYDGAMPAFERSKHSADQLSYIDAIEVALRQISSVSCWTMVSDVSDDMCEIINRNGGETRSVATTTTIGRIRRALEWPDDVGRDAYRGPVFYSDDAFDVLQGPQTLRCFFWKQRRFKPEVEYRFVYSPAYADEIYFRLRRGERWVWYIQEWYPMRCDIQTLIESVSTGAACREGDLDEVRKLCELRHVPLTPSGFDNLQV